jgi:hypothetical protein
LLIARVVLLIASRSVRELFDFDDRGHPVPQKRSLARRQSVRANSLLISSDQTSFLEKLFAFGNFHGPLKRSAD